MPIFRVLSVNRLNSFAQFIKPIRNVSLSLVPSLLASSSRISFCSLLFEKAGRQKTVESKPSKSVLQAIEKLQSLGFNPIVLGSVNHNMHKIQEVDKEKILSIIVELPKREGALRKRLLSSREIYLTRRVYEENKPTRR